MCIERVHVLSGARAYVLYARKRGELGYRWGSLYVSDNNIDRRYRPKKGSRFLDFFLIHRSRYTRQG